MRKGVEKGFKNGRILIKLQLKSCFFGKTHNQILMNLKLREKDELVGIEFQFSVFFGSSSINSQRLDKVLSVCQSIRTFYQLFLTWIRTTAGLNRTFFEKESGKLFGNMYRSA